MSSYFLAFLLPFFAVKWTTDPKCGTAIFAFSETRYVFDKIINAASEVIYSSNNDLIGSYHTCISGQPTKQFSPVILYVTNDMNLSIDNISCHMNTTDCQNGCQPHQIIRGLCKIV